MDNKDNDLDDEDVLMEVKEHLDKVLRFYSVKSDKFSMGNCV